MDWSFVDCVSVLLAIPFRTPYFSSVSTALIYPTDSPSLALPSTWSTRLAVLHLALVVNSYDELSFLVCHLSLLTPDGEDATMMQTSAGEVVSMLYGTLVATPAEMQDQSGAAGTYLCFPDVSIRHVGRFKLKASLLRITG